VVRVPTRHILSITLSIGTRLPAYCTSMGRYSLLHYPNQSSRGIWNKSSFDRGLRTLLPTKSAFAKS